MKHSGWASWRQSLAMMLGFWLASILLADWFFHRQPIGWTMGAYVFVLWTGIMMRNVWAGKSRPGRLLGLGLLGLAMAILEEPGAIAIMLAIPGLIMLSMTARGDWSSRLGVWFLRWLKFGSLGWLQFLRDSRLVRRWQKGHRALRRWRVLALAGRWLIPVGLACFFVLMLGLANAVIAMWLRLLRHFVWNMIKDLPAYLPSPGRGLLWVLAAIWVWALLRLHYRRRPDPEPAEILPPQPPRTLTYPNFVVRCLLLFNLVFLVQNLLDVAFLVGGEAVLPQGVSHAQYAHRGAYPLIATALLAALFVLIAFRAGRRTPEMARARRLVYAWLGQNIFLTGSALWRLSLYIQTFTLTRLRVAAFVWMLLIALGLALIIWRIVQARTNAWMMKGNLIALIAVLYCCAFVDFDGFIANFNVGYCAEVSGNRKAPKLDLYYLEHLGPEALPALARLRQAARGQAVADRAFRVGRRLSARLEANQGNWRARTWRRQRLRRAAAEFPEMPVVLAAEGRPLKDDSRQD